MSKSASYNCWDEWDEVDYGDRWEEYDDYVEYNEWDEYDDSYGECYTAGVYSECTTQDTYDDYDDYSEYNEWDEHDDYGECYTAGVYADCGAQDQDYGEVDCPPGDSTYKDNTVNPGEGGEPDGNKQYKVLDILTSQYQVDGYIFDYLMHDTKKNTMIASTRNEDHFVSVEIAGSYDIDEDGDYCVSSYSAVTSEEVIRVNDFLKTIFLTAADNDIYYDENHGGTMIFSGIVGVYIQPGQIVCKSTAYVKDPDETYIIEFFKVRDIISEKIGGIEDLQYESDSEQTIVKSTDDTVYRVDVYNAEFYLDERYVRYKSSVVCEELMLAKQAIVEQFGVPYIDIVCDNNRITYMDNGGISYEILWDDIGGYYYYDYDYYIPANAKLTSTVYIPIQQAVPSNYYRVVRQIQQMTGLPDSVITQDEDGLTYVYGAAVYVPQAIKFGGQVYATWDAVVSALRSAFVDIQSYIHSKGFYHGADDSGVSYDAIVYDGGYKKMLLLRVGLNIVKRIRIVDGTDYYDLALDESYIEDAVKDAFGVSAEELGAHAIEDRILKTYFYNDLHITKQRVSKYSNESFYVHGKKYNVGSYSTTYNGHKYLDKEKLLSLVKSLIPTLQPVSIKPEQENDENYTLFANESAIIKLSGTNLDHTAIQVTEPNGESTWYEQYFTSSLATAVSAKISFKDAGMYIIKCRGRNTIEPERVGETITYSWATEKTITVTVYPALADGLVYLKPYAEYTGCTVSENSSYTTVKYQHDHYGDPETVNYYKQIASPGAYQRKCAYDSYGMYLKRDDFRMDMDFDIVTDNNKNRDWYLEKRIWRLWRNGKVASFSNVKYDSQGRAYYDINMNGNTKKVYKDPELNRFDIKILEGDPYTVQSNAVSLYSESRPTIRNVNNHLVMPQDRMYALFDYSVKLREYVESNYLMKDPAHDLSGNGTNILLFGDILNVDCMFNNDGHNYSSVAKIKEAMNEYFNEHLVNIYDNLPTVLQEAFSYTASETTKLGTLSFEGFDIEVPGSIITRSISEVNPENYTDYTEYAKVALYAKAEEVSKMNKYRRIVVYGGGYSGVCAAYKAAQYSNTLTDFDFEVVLINPVPVPYIGGIGTVGGQNFWDTRRYDNRFPYRGSLANVMSWNEAAGTIEEDRYNTDQKAAYLEGLLLNENVKIYEQHDIVDIAQDVNGKIKSVTIKKIKRGSDGIVDYAGSASTVFGDVFVDASEDGKLTMLSAHDAEGRPAYTRGRYDYPADTLTPPEGEWSKAKQPAATIMFKLKCSDALVINEDGYKSQGVFTCGNKAFNNGEHKMYQFNEKIRNLRFMVKPVNSAWNGGVTDANGKTEWWVNSILIFGVDGTLHNRDSSDYMPLSADAFEEELDNNKTLNHEMISTDDAWLLGRAFIKKYEQELIEIYRDLGFENAEFVKDNNGEIVTGEILYIRETIHAVKDADMIANGTENDNYEVTMRHCHYSYLDDEQDDPADPHSIGLAFYWSDIHPFIKDDCIDDNSYVWGEKSYKKIRHEVEGLSGDSPIEPAFIPYEALTTKYVPNLLISGYAVNASSFAWSEIRVFPNLCVLGDAAGVAAVTALLSGYNPYELKDIAGVRIVLRRYNAILDRNEVV